MGHEYVVRDGMVPIIEIVNYQTGEVLREVVLDECQPGDKINVELRGVDDR